MITILFGGSFYPQIPYSPANHKIPRKNGDVGAENTTVKGALKEYLNVEMIEKERKREKTHQCVFPSH